MEQYIHNTQRASRPKLRTIASLVGMLFLGLVSTDAQAEVHVSYLYTLSDFQGPIPSNWATLTVDMERNEIYAIDPQARDIRVFNDRGMEIYRFGDEGSLGTVMDVAVKEDGSLLVLSRKVSKYSILICNFRGEPVSELVLKNMPSDFSRFSPDRMVYRKGRIFLLDSDTMRIVITDANGRFQKNYDLASIVGIEEKKRDYVEIGGFSVDRDENMLFTIPVLFLAYRLSLDGKVNGWGQRGGSPGRFNIVGGIVSDEKGNYYVADRLKSAILIFDKNFKFLKEFGYRGLRPENLIGPNHLALDAKGWLYVSQLRSRGVSVFEITYQ